MVKTKANIEALIEVGGEEAIHIVIAEYIEDNLVQIQNNTSEGNYLYYDTLTLEVIAPVKLNQMLRPYKVSVDWSKSPVALMDWYHSVGSGVKDLAIYDGVVDLPFDVGENVYNKFGGFNSDNQDWVPGSSYDEHIEAFDSFIKDVIAGSSTIAYDVIMAFLANLVQEPNQKTNLALAMVGTTGTGKGTLAKLVSGVIGSKYFETSQGLSKITGRFNGHLKTKYVIYGNEVEGMTHKDYQVLKSMISEDTLQLEDKGKRAFQMKNRLRFILDGNDLDRFRTNETERRIFYTEVSAVYKGDTDYWTNFNSLLENEDFLNTVHSYLSVYEYNEELLYNVPQSDTQKKIVVLSKGVFYAEVLDYISSDAIKEETVNGETFRFLSTQAIKNELVGLSNHRLQQIIREIDTSITNTRIKRAGKTIRGYRLPNE